MDIWIIENGQTVRYERKGQCNQCGECCCAHAIRYQMSTSVDGDGATTSEEDPEWYADWEGWSFLYAQGIWWWFRVLDIENKPDPCEAYDAETKRCTIWQDPEKFRPICRYWPWNPKDITRFEHCGFEFERIEDNA